jgi:NADH-quinone oxidoreductase subunit F
MEGVTDALQFLRNFNLNNSKQVGNNVVVIGGGNAAIDAARTALRLGANSVNVLYRRTRAEMPAYQEEIEEAEREGVRIETLIAPVEVVGKNGRVSGLKCARMKLGQFDRSGRRRPEASGGPDFLVECDQIIGAIGQSLNPEEILDGTKIELSKANFLKVDPVTGQSSVAWIFSGGDAAIGPASVTQAIGGGERAAVGIDMYLTGKNNAFWRTDKALDTFFDPQAEPAQYVRAKMQTIPVSKRKGNFNEIELSWRESVAQREARRCLRCDYREEC